MFNCSRRLIGLSVLFFIQVKFLELMANPKNVNFYGILLRNIYSEEPFNTMLFVQQEDAGDSRLEVFHRFPVPKIVLTEDMNISMKANFNAEILSIIIFENILDENLMLILAKSLDCIRQTRILIVVLNVENEEMFKFQIGKICESYKMTNVHLHFIFDSPMPQSPVYHQLLPYPEYTWASISKDSNRNHAKLFPKHWRNLHNKTLTTFADQSAGKSLVYEDSHGNQKLTGMLAEMVLLFANHCNAFLKMYRPLVKGDTRIHYLELYELTDAGKLDVPMAMKPSAVTSSDLSDPIIVSRGRFMVPCALPLTTREIYKVLLEFNFFSCVIVCSLILSIAHSIIDIIYFNRKQLWNFILNAHVLPGILGLSFAVRDSSFKGLRIVYFLVGFAGIYMASLFSGKLSTLLTAPPFHKQISTLSDINDSPIKLLLIRGEVDLYQTDLMDTIKDSIVLNTNSTFVLTERDNFNTSYGYFVLTVMWQYYIYRQQYFDQQIFCTTPGLILTDVFSFGMLLPHNSPYMEAMNYLVNHAHAMGLSNAWASKTFQQLLKGKQISIDHLRPQEDHRPLNSLDLIWVWLILCVGLAVSSVIFVVEMCTGQISIKKKYFNRELSVAETNQEMEI